MRIKVSKNYIKRLNELDNSPLGYSLEFYIFENEVYIDFISEKKKYTFDQFLKTNLGFKILANIARYLYSKYPKEFKGVSLNDHNYIRDNLKTFISNNFSDYKNPLDILMSKDLEVLRINFD